MFWEFQTENYKIVSFGRSYNHNEKNNNNNFVKFSIILWVTRFDPTNSNRTSCC